MRQAKIWTAHISRQIRTSSDLTSLVEGSFARKSASKRAEVQHCAVLPNECVVCAKPGTRVCGHSYIRMSSNLASLIDVVSPSVRTAQSAQGFHNSVLP